MTFPSPGQLVVSAMQKLQYLMKGYMEKMGAIFNGLATLITKIM